MPRLFTAIAVPESVDRYLDNVILNSEPLIIQPVKHITLCFFGDVTIQTALRITDALREVKGQQVEVIIEGSELFKPNGSKPILVAMVRPTAELKSLHQHIGEILNDQGIELESRPYKPHITLVRFSSPSAGEVSRVMQRAQNIDISFRADGFVLYGVDRALAPPYFKQREYLFGGALA